jgi:hypothetical protein
MLTCQKLTVPVRPSGSAMSTVTLFPTSVFGWTIQPRLAGDSSMFPAASIARTSK